MQQIQSKSCIKQTANTQYIQGAVKKHHDISAIAYCFNTISNLNQIEVL